MADLLDRIHAEIRERLEASRPAVDEYRMLEAALTALDGVNGSTRRSSSSPSAADPKRPASRRSARAGSKRAPRGANRAAVLRVLGERPGVGAIELATASGVSRTVLYPLLGRLVEQREIVKEQLPGGGTGYARRRVGAGASGSTDTATARAETVASA